MRYSCAALAILLWSTATAAAQEAVRALPPAPNVRPILTLSHEPTPRLVSADDVVARLMQFDRNNDFKIEIDELPERMQTLVVRGDRSDDLKLDIAEIRPISVLSPVATATPVAWPVETIVPEKSMEKRSPSAAFSATG